MPVNWTGRPKIPRLYARLIASIQQRENLLPLAAPAVARLLEHAARTVSDRTKLSAQVAEIYDIMREGEHAARRDGRDAVAADDIRFAIQARIYRSDRIRETMYERIERDSVLISTDGEAVGQINGLSVLTVGRILVRQTFPGLGQASGSARAK